MDEKTNHRITVLVEGNYEVWRIQMTAVLVAADLWDVVRPAGEVITEEMPKGPKAVQALQKKRELARSKITLAVDASQLPFVMGMENPREMWAALEVTHRSSSVNSALSLRRSFLRMVKSEDESAISWIGRVRARALELSHTPCPATVIDIILVITEGLPVQYAPVLTQLESLPFESLTVTAVTTRIMGFEAQVNRAQAKFTDLSDINAYVARADVICHQCNGFGHYRNECPTPKTIAKPKNVRGAPRPPSRDDGDGSEGRMEARVVHMDGETITLF